MPFLVKAVGGIVFVRWVGEELASDVEGALAVPHEEVAVVEAGG
jgi:hypothetical protein